MRLVGVAIQPASHTYAGVRLIMVALVVANVLYSHKCKIVLHLKLDTVSILTKLVAPHGN